MPRHATLPLGRLIAVIAAFVLAGTPLVAYLWETLNRLLAGHAVAGRIALAVPVALLLAGLLALLARTVRRWEGRRRHRTGTVLPR
jgi:hypothetical protein